MTNYRKTIGDVLKMQPCIDFVYLHYFSPGSLIGVERLYKEFPHILKYELLLYTVKFFYTSDGIRHTYLDVANWIVYV